MSSLLALQSKIVALQQKANQIRAKEFATTVLDIQTKMKAFGITLDDLKAATKAPKHGRKKQKRAGARVSKLAGTRVQPKYRNTNGQTWSGRGVAPKWITEAIALGQSKEIFLIVGDD